MISPKAEQLFLAALELRTGDVVSIIGAGGKTSLMFRLAREARQLGMRVLVTTSTRIRMPEPGLFDQLDLSGEMFLGQEISTPGIYLGGTAEADSGKIRGVREDLLSWQRRHFDLVLIEADGAAEKPLKGWRQDEPVIFDFTTATIGVVDIQTLGRQISDLMVHRMEIFTSLTGAEAGETLNVGHLLRLIAHPEGLFAKGLGRELLLINKVESSRLLNQAALLGSQLENLRVVMGSVREGLVHG